jgi:hypothetical protein
MEVLSEAGRWQKRRRNETKNGRTVCEMRERRGLLLEGAVCRYLAVGIFQWKGMRWKEKMEKFT